MATKKKTTRKSTKKTGARTTRKNAPKTPAVKPAAQAKADKPKRVSALDAAVQVLRAASEPMRAKQLITAMAEQGLWTSPKGKTPHATLYAAMLREIATRGGKARFKKVDRGAFAAN